MMGAKQGCGCCHHLLLETGEKGGLGDEEQGPKATTEHRVLSTAPALGAGFDIFTSTSCFLLSSHPELGNGSFPLAFLPAFPLALGFVQCSFGTRGARGFLRLGW